MPVIRDDTIYFSYHWYPFNRDFIQPQPNIKCLQIKILVIEVSC